MCRRPMYLISFPLVVGLVLTSVAGAAEPDPVGWWKLDDDGTGTVLDYSGNDHHGTLQGDAHFVPGLYDEAVALDGAGDYVNIDGYKGICGTGTGTPPFTITAWIKATGNGEIVGWASGGAGNRVEFRIDQNRLRYESGGGNVQGDTPVTDDRWHHVAVTIPENAVYVDVTIYLDGEDDTQPENDTDPVHPVADNDVKIGRRYNDTATRDFLGLIDDVRLYDRVLTQAEIQELAKRPRAYDPDPPDGALLETPMVMLGWTPGSYAAQHDVYFGTDESEVANGTGGTLVGRQSEAFYYLAALDVGRTYYWRIDDIEADGITIHKGDVWRFTVASKIAGNPDPSEGLRYVDLEVTLSWTAGSGAILHDVYFGTDESEVADGAGDTAKGQRAETTYTPESLAPDTTYYWRIDEFDGATTYKGDVWRFRTRPLIAITDPNLIGWWKLDDVGSGTVIDFSGYDRDGMLVNDPLWVPGYDGDALSFNGNNQYVAIQDLSYSAAANYREVTVCAWIRTVNSFNQAIVAFDRDEYWRLEINGNGGGAGQVGWSVYTDQGQVDVGSTARVDDGQWHHVAGVFDHGTLSIYIDGGLDGSTSEGETFGRARNTRYGFIGSRSEASSFNGSTGTPWPFAGELDDVRIYDQALTEAGLAEAMRGDPRLAWGPKPTNDSITDIERATPLSWSPGEKAAQHDVYLGTDADAVTDAGTSDTSGIYRGRQDPNTYTPGEALEFDQTYYWRIDQYNTDETVTRGRVWSFTVSNYLVVDDIEAYDDFCNRIFYSWTDGFGYSADPDCGIEAYTGNGTGSTVGNLAAPFAERSIVHGGSQSMPFAYDNSALPYYSQAEHAFVSPQDWTRHGVKALTLWFRGNPESASTFTEGPAGTYTMTARSANIYGTTDHFHYLFKRLSGVGSIVAKVESVTNTANDAKAGVMIRETADDPSSTNAFVFFRPDGGVRFNRRLTPGDATTGFNPGDTYTTPHWLKLERHLGGTFRAYHSTDGSTWEELDMQVMVQMDNDVYIGLALCSQNTGQICRAVFSEVMTTGTITGQWQSQDIGIASNTADQLYVAVQDSGGQSAVINHEDPDAILLDSWQEWNIDMKELAGVNLTRVAKMFIGVGNPDNPQLGGTGTLYVDDIWLYRPRCMPDLARPAADFTNDCVVDYSDLQALADNWLVMESDVWDTTGGPDGSGALLFGATGDYVAIEDLFYNSIGLTAVSVSAWIRTNSGANQYIISFDRNEYYRLAINSQSPAAEGQVGWHVMTDAGQSDYGSITRVDDDQWHHVVGVFDNGTSTIYIDGTAEPSATLGTTYGSGNMRYGFLCANSEAPAFDSPTPVAYPIQRLDDVRVYDYALSAADVARLANRTGQPATGPILWYKLDETSGNIAADSSGNGYDGQLRFSWFDMNMHDDSTINFKDYALVVDQWLDKLLWPQP